MAEIYKLNQEGNNALFENASCAFGVFDGVHLGHRFLVDCTCESARKSGGKSMILTFDIDPDEVFRPERLKKLMTNEQRLACLAQTGVDVVAVLPFTRSFAALEPLNFLQQTFNGTPPKILHVGYDFRFGAKAKGTVKELTTWGATFGMRVEAHDLKAEDDQPITATRIRLLLSEGKIEEANRLLGKLYTFCGRVEAGRGEGRELGFSTANLHIPSSLRVLGDGVYAAWVVVDGQRYKAAVSVGVAPTFADSATATSEVHLLNFDGDLYGKTIAVSFVHFLRPMMTFSSVEELVATVKANIAWVQENLSETDLCEGIQ